MKLNVQFHAPALLRKMKTALFIYGVKVWLYGGVIETHRRLLAPMSL
jgi:hypothetical protein